MSDIPMLPWRIERTDLVNDYVSLRSDDGDVIFWRQDDESIVTDGPTAAFIAKAVNNYDAMLTALKLAYENIVACGGHSETAAILRHAIKKAT
jgi:hypothetical protein